MSPAENKARQPASQGKPAGPTFVELDLESCREITGEKMKGARKEVDLIAMQISLRHSLCGGPLVIEHLDGRSVVLRTQARLSTNCVQASAAPALNVISQCLVALLRRKE